MHPIQIVEAERKVQIQKAKCLLGSEEHTRILRTEEWNRSCAAEGSCDAAGHWRIVWRVKAIHKRKLGIAYRTWKQSINFKFLFFSKFLKKPTFQGNNDLKVTDGFHRYLEVRSLSQMKNPDTGEMEDCHENITANGRTM